MEQYVSVEREKIGQLRSISELLPLLRSLFFPSTIAFHIASISILPFLSFCMRPLLFRIVVNISFSTFNAQSLPYCPSLCLLMTVVKCGFECKSSTMAFQKETLLKSGS